MCPEQAPARPVKPGAKLLCLLVLFEAGFLPFSQSFFHWSTDERRYTNAAIMFSHPQLILASIRSIHDVLLCLFMLLSVFSILSLTAVGRRPPGEDWAAYLGAGLAAASKGLLALVFLLFAWVFSRVDPPARGAGTRPPSLVHLPSMLVAVAVAGWWYAVMYEFHGVKLLHEVWGDQVAENMKHVMWQPLYRIPAYAALQMVSLLPWTLALLVLVQRDRRALAAPEGACRISRLQPGRLSA